MVAGWGVTEHIPVPDEAEACGAGRASLWFLNPCICPLVVQEFEQELKAASAPDEAQLPAKTKDEAKADKP